MAKTRLNSGFSKVFLLNFHGSFGPIGLSIGVGVALFVVAV